MKRRQRPGFWLAIGAMVLASFAPAGAKAPPAQAARAGPPMVALDRQTGRVSVQATRVPWPAFVAAWQRRTGIALHAPPPEGGVLSASFQKLPLRRALERIFGPNANLVLLYDASDSRSAPGALPREVLVLREARGGGTAITGRQAKRPSTPAPRAPAPPTGPDAIPDEHAELPSMPTDGEGDRVEAASREFQRNPDAAREAALSASDPEVRQAAIAALGDETDQQTIGVLLEVVRDPDPVVKASALALLASLAEADPQLRATLGRMVEAATDREDWQRGADALGISLGSLTGEAPAAEERERKEGPM